MKSIAQPPVMAAAPRVDGKFLQVEARRFFVKGVAYGTFAPNADGLQFPEPARLASDFSAIAAAGFNTIRTYTVPSRAILDAAAKQGLRVMVGMPWPQHMAFLDDARLVRTIRRDAIATVRELASHPAALMFAVGNEIPPGVVRWHGRARVERFLGSLYNDVKSASPDSVLTYVNFPPTEYLDLDCFDVCSFNVYLHREPDLRAYLARLQHIAGVKPLLLAEAGGDSQREGQDGQARITAMHIRTAFSEGACGAIAFSWTDEWWRGGHAVEDWAFGLVDSERRPKAALTAVTQTFTGAPFTADERASWPKVSVVVCAYDAAETIDDCLSSLAGLTYPDFEVIVVNDGSRDATGAIARRHSGVTVIDIPNGGLSAARNVGLAAASGAIVAYTDADVRVDPDWLSYLVQPLLREGVSGAGGPNVVPADDTWMAQCVARAPGGPTHVLIDDRIAEHVPGCNMAFWREALLSIGGFNPAFLRAGDDVDICWRLQAKGLRIGFAPAALVWHRHRATIDAFWRQQVGYGEAEAWLNVHHPEKFSGGRMLWRGRIYSPLPFARDLRRPHVNTGVWGTAAFPSVYWAESQLWQFLPHSAAWMTISSSLLVLAVLGLPDPAHAAWLLLTGAAGWLTTLARCVVLARRSDVQGLRKLGSLSPAWSRLVYRGTIAWLHVLQPLARMRGRIRGMWSLPQVARPESGERQPWQSSLPSLGDARRSGRLLAGLENEQTFWSESWLAHTTVLSELAAVLRALRPARVVESDDGWHPERDLSLAIGRWGWIDVRVLVEEHAEGRCLLRVATRLRVGAAGLVQGVALAALLTGGIAAATFGWLPVAAVATVISAAVIARAAWRTSRGIAVVTRALTRLSDEARLIPLPASSGSRSLGHGWRLVTPGRALQAALLILVIAVAAIGRRSSAELTATEQASALESSVQDVATDGGVAVGIAGDIFIADSEQRVIRRLRPRPPAGALFSADDIAADGDPVLGAAIPFDTAADLAIATDGDLFVADARRNRIMRIVPSTGEVALIAGSGQAGFSGDGQAAHGAALHGPSALAIAHNGDLYFADTLNNRVRLIAHGSGVVSTVAGDGQAGDGANIGDGGLAGRAHLNRPMGVAVDHNGDLYISDTGHQRVRKIDVSTGVITTVAGDGSIGAGGDGGPATQAALAWPTGLSLAPSDRGVFVYVADSGNNRVRVIDPDGSMTSLKGSVVAPTRIAYHPAGWLYVKDSSHDGVSALAASVPSAMAGDPALRRSVGGD